MAAPLAVVLKGYPRLSETFIAQELAALEARGHEFEIWSLRQPYDDRIHPIHDQIRARRRYLPEYLWREPLRVLRGVISVAGRRGFRRALGIWLRDLARDRTANRVRRFGQACVLAAELPRATRFIYAHFLHTPASVARYAAVMRGIGWGFSAHAKDIWTIPDWEKREKIGAARFGVTCTRAGAEHLSALDDTVGAGAGDAAPSDADTDGAAASDAARAADTAPCTADCGSRMGAGGGLRTVTHANPARGKAARAPGAAGVPPTPGTAAAGVSGPARRGKIGLVYHGLDLGRFPPPPDIRPHRDRLALLSVGRLVEKKGYDDLIDALAALPAGLNWQFVHIGGGKLEREMRARAAAAGIEGRIDWRGKRDQTEVIDAMRRADLFVLPSKIAGDGDRDGLPNVLMEAASQKLPILSTAIAAIPEFIVDGVQGRLVTPGDPAALSAAIVALAADPALRRRMADQAYRRLVAEFGMESGIDMIDRELRAALASG